MSEKPPQDDNQVEKAIPVQSEERVEFVDIIRGFALLGVFLANMVSFSGQTTVLAAYPKVADKAAIFLIEFLVRAKFYTLFSFLFGWGMAVQMLRAKARGSKFLFVYLKRIFILLIIGILHAIFIWSGDILTTYALFGFLLVLFRNRSGKLILLTSIILLIFAFAFYLPSEPFASINNWYNEFYQNLTNSLIGSGGQQVTVQTGGYWELTVSRAYSVIRRNAYVITSIGNVFSMFLLGLYVGKKELFKNAEKHTILFRWVLIISFLVGVTLNGFFIAVMTWNQGVWPTWMNWVQPASHNAFRIGVRTFGAPALMLFYVTAIIFLSRKVKWREKLAPLSYIGRMALTNYLLQSIIGTYLFFSYGLGFFGEVSPSFGIVLTLLIFYAQIRFSKWWMDRYQYGPMEWLWRTFTYGQRQPMQHGDTYDDIKPIGWVKKIRNLNPARALAGSWIALIIWASILGYYYQNLDLSSSQLGINLGQSNDEQVLDGILDDGDDQNVVPEIVTPDVNPVPYNPGPIAASGNLEALAQTFEIESALEQIDILTSPPYLGRYAGSPEGFAAGNYIADKFAEYGLQPAGDDGSFFQEFPLNYISLQSDPIFSIESPNGNIRDYVFHEDFSVIVSGYLGEGSIEGDLVWANNCFSDDFDDLDAVNTIVLCRNSNIGIAARNAIENGAIGLLILTDAEVRSMDFGTSYYETWVPVALPALRVSPETAADLVLGSGRTVEDLSIYFSSFPLMTRVHIEIDLAIGENCSNRGCVGRNVLGVIPGRDPNFKDEVVIIGGHYDHLGESPGDAIIWSGANDNGSGLAVILEIARGWHEQGYVPSRTIMFAAWDGEEQGLLGSRYYVENPKYALENTTAAILLDMVGTGSETLHIDGAGGFEDYIQKIAAELSIQTELTDIGRSDHAPFLFAGVRSNLISRFSGDNSLDNYHRPSDTLEFIEPDKLEQIGILTNLLLLGLTEGEAQIAHLMDQRSNAVNDENLAAFLATSKPELIYSERFWFEDVQSFNIVDFGITISDVNVIGRTASARVDYMLEYQIDESGENNQGDNEEPVTRILISHLEVRFEQTDLGWLWAGPNQTLLENANLLIPSEGETDGEGETSIEIEPIINDGPFFVVGYPEGITEDQELLINLGLTAAEQYEAFAGLMGLPTSPPATIQIFTDMDFIRASSALSLPGNISYRAEPGIIKFLYSDDLAGNERLPYALAQLLLAEAGVNEPAAPWLWNDGLASVLISVEDPLLIQPNLLPRLEENILSGESIPDDISSWAATEFLRQRLGWSGLGRFISDLGSTCQQNMCSNGQGLDSVLTSVLGVDSIGFENLWKSYWLKRITEIQADLNTIMDTRSIAILGRNRTGFLNTVDPNVLNLLSEQGNWFDELSRFAITTFSTTSEPFVVFDDGRILANIILSYELNGTSEPFSSGTVTTQILFTPQGAGLRWAGAYFETMQNDQITIFYSPNQEDLAEGILEEAQEIFESAKDLLVIDSSGNLLLKLYQGENIFRTSIFLNFNPLEWSTGWTSNGESIKLLKIGDNESDDYHEVLATQIIRYLLFEEGVTSEWIIKGMTAFHAQYLNNDLVSEAIFSNLRRISSRISNETLSSLTEMPRDFEIIDQRDWGIETSHAWDTLRYISYIYGESSLENFIDSHASGTSVVEALEGTIGITFEEFESNWAISLAQGHALPEWINLMDGFNVENLNPHIEFLLSEELAGREAGTIGEELAAEYIADKFVEYGLLPFGDLVVEDITIPEEDLDTEEQTQTDEGLIGDDLETNQEPEYSYFQFFPIEYSALLNTPIFEILPSDGQVSDSFDYKSEFTVLLQGESIGGFVESELVWINGDYSGLDLGGKIAVRSIELSMEEEILLAKEHGAGGLILINTLEYRRERDLLAKLALPIEYSQGDPIPVIILGVEGYNKLLEITNLTNVEINEAPPALPLGIQARINISLSEIETLQSANVLGLLPGSDPTVSDEIIIIGAHYDHVGNDPDTLTCDGLIIDSPEEFVEALCDRIPGLKYSGGNDNATGVALLLEIARFWQEIGYRPSRSILFAAWGAQEPGEIGSSFFVENPTISLENTIAMFQLDSIGGGSGYYLSAQGEWISEGLMLYGMDMANDILGLRLTISQDIIRSDQDPFREVGIPAMLVSWAGATNELNWPDIMADEIEPYRIDISSRLTMLALMMLAR